jgi:tetratricopeptide (TPR) repeat protein
MNANIYKEKTMRLSAFVGRSFSEGDKKVWHDLRDILDGLKPMGFEYEDGKEGQIRPISEKVRELILRHEVYIGVLTKRYPIWEAPSSWRERWLYPLGSYTPQKWTTSEWVIEEVGFAIGKDRKILLLIEKDVYFPTSDLDGDTQWILFSRENLSASQTEISQMILNLISQRVTSIAEPVSVATTSPSDQEKVASQEPTISEQIEIIKDHVLNGRYIEADRTQSEIVKSQHNDEMRSFFDAFILRLRACSNDNEALARLIKKCADCPSDFDAIQQLASVYSSFEQPGQASQLLISHLDKVPSIQRNKLVLDAATAMCDDNMSSEAISLLVEQLRKEQDESEHIALYRGVARAAEKANNIDLEISFLEKVVKLLPTDNDARFRLAYVYSNNDQDRQAAYHYKLVVDHSDWPGASNNLGVVYEELGYKASQYNAYMRVAEKYPLAKANLALIYANAGIHSEAKNLANAVLPTTNDVQDSKIAIDRARFVLDEIAKMERAENKDIDRIAEDTKVEREFMSAYAEAYCAPYLGKFEGSYSTVHGVIDIAHEEGNLNGTGTHVSTSPRGLVNPRGLVSNYLTESSNKNSQGQEVLTDLLSLSAQLHGQAGTFKVNISPSVKPDGLLSATSRTIKGLLYLKDNGNDIQFLEMYDKKRTVVSAQRKS